jgi:DNA-binding response OmpR family regulator
MAVLLLTRDLSVVSQIDGAAARVGVAARTVASGGEVVAQCADADVDLIVLDLSIPSLHVRSLVEGVNAARSSRPRIVAFGSHVHVDKLTSAREAGCDEVMSRGQFFGQLDAVIRGG